MKINFVWLIGLTLVLTGFMVLTPNVASAHCDTLDGPVVMTAKTALETGNLTPVLKWVKPDYEHELKTAFAKTLAVRGKGAEAKELADTYFLETLVRLHRAGEGAPFEGLKPAGLKLPAAVVEGDKALETGSADKVIHILKHNVEEGIHARFEKVMALKKHENESVQAGRAFVDAYVEYIHYVEGLYVIASGQHPHGGEGAKEGHDKH